MNWIGLGNLLATFLLVIAMLLSTSYTHDRINRLETSVQSQEKLLTIASESLLTTQQVLVSTQKNQMDLIKVSQLVGEVAAERQRLAIQAMAQAHFRVAFEEARRGRKDVARSQLLDGVQLILGDQISCISLNNVSFTFDKKEWMDTLVPLFQDSYLQVIVAGFNKADPPILVGLRDCGPKS